jgi:hypothetical protein
MEILNSTRPRGVQILTSIAQQFSREAQRDRAVPRPRLERMNSSKSPELCRLQPDAHIPPHIRTMSSQSAP